MALTKPTLHCTSLNVSEWRAFGHQEGRGPQSLGRHLCWDSWSSCISSVPGYHSSFLLHLQSTVSPCSLCCNTCSSLAGRGTDFLAMLFSLFTVTISLDGHFLQNEVPELILMQNSSSRLPDLSITLLDSHNNRVTTELQNKNRQKYTANLKKLEAKDSGTWVCQVHSDSPLINQNISFAVKVLGMWQQNWNSHTGLGTSVPFSSWV